MISLPVSAPASLRQVGIGLRQPHYEIWCERRPDIGFVEVHSENFFADGGAALAVLHEVRAFHSVSLHGVGLSLGSVVGLDPWHLDRLTRLVERIDPVRVSDHASFSRAPGGAGGKVLHANDLLPIAFTQASLDIMVVNVQQAQERLKRQLLVENLSAYLQWADFEMSEPEFLNSLAQRTGCGLLVDVNNLVVNSLNAGKNPVKSANRWIEAIDPRHVGEMHLAGYRELDDIFIDDHGSRVRPPVWSAYRHALECFGTVPTLLEWDTDLPELDVLLGEAELAARHQKAAQSSVYGDL